MVKTEEAPCKKVPVQSILYILLFFLGVFYGVFHVFLGPFRGQLGRLVMLGFSLLGVSVSCGADWCCIYMVRPSCSN